MQVFLDGGERRGVVGGRGLRRARPTSVEPVETASPPPGGRTAARAAPASRPRRAGPPPTAAGQVGPAGVAEVAEPVVVGRPRGHLRLERREHVVADHLAATARVPHHLAATRRRTSATRRRRPASRSSTGGPTTRGRRRRPARSSAVAPGRDLEEVGDRVGVAPGSTGSRQPQEVRDQRGAVLGQDRLRVELHALQRQRRRAARPSPCPPRSRAPSRPGRRAARSAASEW